MEKDTSLRRMEKLRLLAKELEIDLSDDQLGLFDDFYDRLVEKNKVMNLTAITELDDVIVKHFLDSISLVKAVDLTGQDTCERILDIGTGAGFPGIPLRITFPHHRYVLADSLNKRIKFIEEYIDDHQFDNIETVHGRAEDLARMELYREKFDLCVSRAVANLSSLSEYALPFVRTGGSFVSYKAGGAGQEIADAEKAIRMLGGRIEKKITFVLPHTDLERMLVVIRKEKPTPKRYPRKAGTPSREPLR